jgi:hypothetical protein
MEEREGRGWVSIAFEVDTAGRLPALVAGLAACGWRGTFFATEEALMEAPETWRRLALEGHEIGALPLFGMTDDGRLPNWTRAMLAEDLRMFRRLADELLPDRPIRSVALPGREHLCSDGSYLPEVRRAFDFSLGRWPGVNRRPCGGHVLRCADVPLPAPLESEDWAILRNSDPAIWPALREAGVAVAPLSEVGDRFCGAEEQP